MAGRRHRHWRAARDEHLGLAHLPCPGRAGRVRRQLPPAAAPETAARRALFHGKRRPERRAGPAGDYHLSALRRELRPGLFEHCAVARILHLRAQLPHRLRSFPLHHRHLPALGVPRLDPHLAPGTIAAPRDRGLAFRSMLPVLHSPASPIAPARLLDCAAGADPGRSQPGCWGCGPTWIRRGAAP